MVNDQTICALATPPGRSAIAIVRVSGPASRSVASRVFRARRPLKPRVATVGTILGSDGAPIDRGVALFAPAPRSYTGEDTLELHVHGSPVVVRETVQGLLAAGVRYALPGEFTRRAFLNGKLDLQGAGAIADLIAAESRSAARAALANLSGGLAHVLQELRSQLGAVLEDLAAAVDFPDEVPSPDSGRIAAALDSVHERLHRLQSDGEVGRLLREGVAVAIVGPPNAGKSSLLNALLGEERAIVSELPGTTRDTIEESVTVAGVQVRLIDTAGIREHADRLESAGMERTRRALRASRVALVVVDGSQVPTRETAAILAQTAERPRVVFANKADLGDAGAAALDVAHVRGSVHDPHTLDALREALAQAAWGGGEPDLERPHLATLYELDAVAAAARAIDFARGTLERGEPADLIVGDLQRAAAELGHITIDGANEQMLSAIFARFCVGK